MNFKTALFVSMIAATAATGAHAAIPYRTEQVNMPVVIPKSGKDSQAVARVHRFYVGGAYDFQIWGDVVQGAVNTDGGNASSFDAYAGVRVSDTFRLEAAYIRNRGDWDAFSIAGNTVMANAIVDARIDSMYRVFRRQRIVPYVGVGAGASWLSADDVDIAKKTVPALAALAGVGFELGDWFTVDMGYRYMYNFPPKIAGADDAAMTSHQLRAGVRVNF